MGECLMLERICSLEQYRAMLAELTPGQLAVVAVALELTGNNRMIADVLGVSEGTVERRFRMARRRLKQAFPGLDTEGRLRTRGQGMSWNGECAAWESG